MTGQAAIEKILEQYKRHGWTLRRVLLSAQMRSAIANFAELFSPAEVHESELDAAWFSRSSRPGMTAWELRHLSTAPYALVEVIPDGTSQDIFEVTLKRAEERILSARSGKLPN